MSDASYAFGNFTGGEISTFAQGRFDKPDYRTSLKRCRNAFPVEAGAWVRRPGTRYAGTTLNGAPGRVIEFDVKQSAPITGEYTDGKLRFRSGTAIVGGTLDAPYVGGSWANIRVVQAETTQILLEPSIAPQALINTTGNTFTINPATFNDGPYLDPFTNGVQATPSATKGIITLTVSFAAYDSGKAYAKGAFVTDSSVNYISLQNQNVSHTPASSGSFWAATSVNAAINGGQGFLGTDTGRLVRLYSEPVPWASGASYTPASVVSFNLSGLPGAASYYQSLVTSSTTVQPGTDVTTWKLLPDTAALWSWGRITGLSNIVDRTTGTAIGNMVGGGGLAGAFNGTFSQVGSSGAELGTSGGAVANGTVLTLSGYVGRNLGGQAIEHVAVYPSTDLGLGAGTFTYGGGGGGSPTTTAFVPTFVLNLRGKATAPASASDGTLLGTSGSIANTTASISIASSDQVTSWNYVWIEQIATFTINTTGGVLTSSYAFTSAVGQLSMFAPTGTGSSSAISVEIIGPTLLYSNTIKTWRLGVYSNTTGWPTCGVYDDGRVWFGGAVDNRVDACYSNGVDGGTLNFAPTDQYGAVTPANAISYTFNSKGVNQVLWMRPDLQGIKVGTQAGEWLIQVPTAGPISPLNITAHNVTNHGSENIEPVDTEHTLVFIQRFARKLLEYFPDVFSGKFSAPNLADKAAHFTRAGVAELAYTSAVTPIIWGRCVDGSWFGITYKRDSLASSQPPTFYGWHGHTLGSGRVVESICSGASVGGDLDALTMVTNDPVTNIRHVEILTDVQDEDTPLADSWYLDDGVLPTLAAGASSAVLSGLPWPDGTVVQAFCAGLDCGEGERGAISDFTVTSGAITIPYGDTISVGPGRGLFTAAAASAASAAGQLIVGFTYDSDGQTVRPMTQADSGARNGPAFAKLSRGHRYGLKLVNTNGIKIGGSFDRLLPAALKQTNSASLIAAGTTFSGVAYGELLDDYDYEGGTPCWRVSRPFPANVVIVGVNLATMDQ